MNRQETTVVEPDWRAATGVVRTIHRNVRTFVDDQPLHPCIKFFETVSRFTVEQFEKKIDEQLRERLQCAASKLNKKLRNPKYLLSFFKELVGNLRRLRRLEFTRRERTLKFFELVTQ